jgi:hypothetical protein
LYIDPIRRRNTSIEARFAANLKTAEGVNRYAITINEATHISQMSQMLHKVANEAIVQIGTHQIGTS